MKHVIVMTVALLCAILVIVFIIFSKDALLIHHLYKNDCDIDRIESLLSGGASPDAVDSQGRPALDIAIIMHHKSAVNLLLERGADVNYHTPDGGALHAAIYCAHEYEDVEVFEMIMNMQPNADIMCADGLTPLYHAVVGNQIHIVQRLLDYGASLEMNRNGFALFDVAAFSIVKPEVRQMIFDARENREASQY